MGVGERGLQGKLSWTSHVGWVRSTPMDRSIHPSELHLDFSYFGRPFLTSANVLLCALTIAWYSQS